MIMFKRKDDDWNIWDDDEVSQETSTTEGLNQRKKRLFHKKKEKEELWQEDGTVNYLDVESGNIYTKEEKMKYSKLKISVLVLLCLSIFFGVVGHMNTDFDENNKAYVVDYDLHYERQYVALSDKVYEYCLELKDELSTVMPQLSTNSLALTNTVHKMNDTLSAKTAELSRYTEVPELMSSYNDNLISFSLSTQKMLNTMLTNYTSSDYLAWAESAYNDFCNSLQTLTYLRGQINEVIYRNVYGGD